MENEAVPSQRSSATASSLEQSAIERFLFFPRETKRRAAQAPSLDSSHAILDREYRLQKTQTAGVPNAESDTPAVSAEPYFVEDVEALAHVLFLCPPVIEAQVNQWLKRLHPEFSERPEESILKTLQMLLGTAPQLRIFLRRITKFTGAIMSNTCAFSFLFDYTRVEKRRSQVSTEQPRDYECDDIQIQAAMKDAGYDTPAGFVDCLFAILESSLVTYEGRGGFRQRSFAVAGSDTTIYEGFESNYILKPYFRRSYFIVAILRYVLNFASTLFESESFHKSSNVDEIEADQETARKLVELCHQFVAELRHRSSALASPGDSLDEALLCYLPFDGDAHALEESDRHMERLYGVPLEIATSENDKQILLWLEHIWLAQTSFGGPLDEEEDSLAGSGDPRVARVGYRRLVDDLWRALSVAMQDQFMHFLDEFVESRLIPVLNYLHRS